MLGYRLEKEIRKRQNIFIYQSKTCLRLINFSGAQGFFKLSSSAGVQDTISESFKISIAVGVAFQDFYLVVHAFSKSIGVRIIF